MNNNTNNNNTPLALKMSSKNKKKYHHRDEDRSMRRTMISFLRIKYYGNIKSKIAQLLFRACTIMKKNLHRKGTTKVAPAR
jgi:hypothetical protein